MKNVLNFRVYDGLLDRMKFAVKQGKAEDLSDLTRSALEEYLVKIEASPLAVSKHNDCPLACLDSLVLHGPH
jgi:hypothetical protein